MIDILAVSTASVTAINRNIYVQLAKEGWNIEMVVPVNYPVTSSNTLKAEPQRNGDPPIHFLKLKGRNPRMFRFPDLADLLSSLKPKVVFIESDPVSYLAWQTGRWCKANNSYLLSLSCENQLFTILSTYQRRGVMSLPAAFVKSVLFYASRKKINTVFTISNDGTNIYKREGYTRVIKIPLGFDPNIFFKDEVKRKLIRDNLNLKRPVVAYFGRIVKEKGVDILIRALAELKQLEWHLMLDKFNVYANHYHQFIDDLIDRCGIRDRIISIDANHLEIAAFMNAADVVVLPSISTTFWKEQYGRVAPEAMACGKLVIAAKSGTLPELVDNCGLLFDEGNTSQLKQLLTEILDTPDRYESLRVAAAERAHNFLSITQQAAAYGERFTELGLIRHKFSQIN